ncbi:glutamyl-tRNA reductase [Silanimonas sp.]|uniref:glutamyl-tRNA reductase n=1 Tax=Silanimonas sp. TaxID=1929290 RepID=UPI001BBEEC12|nr:glutamyl-tRNA reductase [Silanimonas sp.]MBS3895169.1 glutamyl-tRNA reductase [Silanimonas sp.]MBS3924944.1 glutamyl-tRNA reductase [Xanthomonadaceae bacterium]
MPLIALGVNHQTAPVDVRERVAVGDAQLPATLRSLLAVPGVEEAALLSTCNRTELYAHLDNGAAPDLIGWMAQQHGIDRHALATYTYQHHEAEAARHLFRVATGLDSLVLGEPQILGQVKAAWQSARGAGSLRTPLDRLFQHGFQVAKRVRTDTRIGAHPVSVAYAGVRLVRQVFAELDRATVLLIGAGDTIELAAKHLVNADAKRLLIANRTLEHAQALASRVGGYALALSETARHLPEADVVISATAAREPVLRAATVREALKARRQRPMFLLDLAVPRDIEAAVADLPDAYLYTVDDLEQVISENKASRQMAAEQAEVIIELAVEHYMAWWRAQDRQDSLRALRRSAERAKALALERARERLASGEPAEAVMARLAHQLTNQLLHSPSTALRQAAIEGDSSLLAAAARLFPDPDATPPGTPPERG